MKAWLKNQWLESFAINIWNDLTPLGRLTIFVPAWFICVMMVPLALIVAGPAWLLDKILSKLLEKLGKIFIK